MFHRALLTIDGSAVALAAVETAVRATLPDGVIVVLTVIPSIEQLIAATASAGAAGRRVSVSDELATQSLEAYRREASAHLEQAAAAIRTAGGRVGETVIMTGEPGPAIVRTAEERGCDLVVMTTNGRSGWRRAVLGSVSDHVVRHSEQVPVLLVRRPVE